MSDDTLTLRAAVAQTAAVVGSAHEARWICEVATGLDGGEYDGALDEPLTERMVAHLDAMVARLGTGEPLPYVLGRWSFRHLDLAIDRRVLIPRPETELVSAAAIALASVVEGPRVVADLGTGSGAIGLSMADELPLADTTVWITDVSDEALAVARANLAGLGRPASNVRVGIGSWYDALPPGAVFDVIVSNPPYVAEGAPELAATVADWEPAGALFAGGDGLAAIRLLIDGASERLAPGGSLVLEIGADQGEAVRSLLEASDLTSVEIRQDLAGHDRIAVARRP